MSSVKRVYVEKKPEYAVQAKALKSEMKNYLGIQNVENVRSDDVAEGDGVLAFLYATRDVTSSGSDVPSATIVRPMTVSDMPKSFAKKVHE